MGSDQSISHPNTVLNTICAQAIDELAGQVQSHLEAGMNKEEAIIAAIANNYRQHGAIVFNGDGYSQAWHSQAEERGLLNLATTPDALAALVEDETVDAFARYKVLSRRELEARLEVSVEQYIIKVGIEAETAANIARTLILPAAIDHLDHLGKVRASLRADTLHDDHIDTVTSNLASNIAKLERAMVGHQGEEGLAHACYMRDAVLPCMEALRANADILERMVADKFWPLPKYAEMLFIK